MKEIKAYIQKHKLDTVISALHGIAGLSGVSTLESCGYDIGWVDGEGDMAIDCRPGLKLEIACRDDLVAKVVETIEKAAHTGLKGNGRIYVGPLEIAVCIGSRERGEGAI